MGKLLISMGMVDAFDRVKCDFSRMSLCNDLVLSKVVHKSFVEDISQDTQCCLVCVSLAAGPETPRPGAGNNWGLVRDVAPPSWEGVYYNDGRCPELQGRLLY
ncbi:hypothetical protein NFI96_015452 [Prochilodus magdalenae]|nr:hypothetical protein NFI96_015452 [Prochilodus magdalenae]